MRTARALALLGALGILSSATRLQAEGAPSPVVARVGDRVITAAELERRLLSIPPFQARSFGKTPEEIKRNFLEKVMIRDLLFSAGAEADKLAERDDVRDRIRGVLRNAALQRIRVEATIKEPIGEDDVKAYYKANESKFHTPARIAIWRIQVSTREEARAILDEMAKDATPKHWNEIAREKSLDHVTNMRGGNLGFVAPDGTTSESGIKVEPALYGAVEKLEDAKILQEPVKDGDRWAVLWRRQSMKAVDRPLEQEATSIRQIIAHQRTEERVTAVLDKLRQELVSESHVELADLVDVSAQGDLGPTRRPGALPATRRPAQATPKETPGGLR